jgi:RHH-type proline utilization regulon transcriptional repressor/proline dehydrogenase/delta 1-pyrroline-5-carboxylate dehydrogenase
MVRLVKGAYWDTEVKRTQERGLEDYPVFTRKAMTDLSYMANVRLLLSKRPRLYPQFATHNALTIASIVETAGGTEGYEFQRLHGMGEATYRALLKDYASAACRTYAPVGGHRDLLAYLVRRLLENGANSSFVNIAGDPDVPVAELLKRPAQAIGSPARARHARLPLPRNLYGSQRLNSRGVEFGHANSVVALRAEIARFPGPWKAASLIGGAEQGGTPRPALSPIAGEPIGEVIEATAEIARHAMEATAAAFPAWRDAPVEKRAAALDKAADLLEARRGLFLALLQAEGGKTIDDALAEVREGIDFLRFYASDARRSFPAGGEFLPGPTGEENRLKHRGRGVFVCISPWNFPLAIFLGQVAAALVSGNSVVAKPAEQTPLIAAEIVKLLHASGVPGSVLSLVVGDGRVGAALVADPRVAGVAFTGSTEVARLINRALAGKDGPIVPLIAETGGINVMVVDGTALPEQVSDDVVLSAFRSAGQRCSALRVLAVEEHVADKMIEMIAGAARELKIGDPRDFSTHVGPVIDSEARGRLNDQAKASKGRAARVHLDGEAPPAQGFYVAPQIIELHGISDLREEIFGPVLHVYKWKSEASPSGADPGLEKLMREVAASGYGLTGGLHTRIDETIRAVERLTPAGNFYVNRNMIGAVVGTQPFGGSGLSGTGPKAGGPNYLKRFANEVVVSINTSAAGGNASLVSMDEE